MEETSHNIVALKNVIQRYAPQSGGNLGGKDVVFLMKEPGVDALVYDNGTFITRSGFGYKRKLNQTGGFITTINKLKMAGYKPFNYFVPGFRERYEAEHKIAEQKKLKAQEVFPVVEKINLRQLPNRLGYEQVSIRQPQVEMQQTISRASPMQRGKFVDEQYRRMFESNIAEVSKIITPTPRIKTPSMYEVLTPTSFAKWAAGEYAGAKKRSAELGVTKTELTQEQILKKQLKQLQQEKQRKPGDTNASKSKE